jgi:hypothetical protein
MVEREENSKVEVRESFVVVRNEVLGLCYSNKKRYRRQGKLYKACTKSDYILSHYVIGLQHKLFSERSRAFYMALKG